MSHDFSSLENDLRDLRPAALDDAMIERLENCAAGTWDRARPVELEFERHLSASVPASLGNVMTERLLSQVGDLPFPKAQPKILPFPATANAEPESRRHGRHWLAAAAAVALMGALAGWFLPGNHRSAAPLATDRPAMENGAPVTPQPAVSRPSPLVPAGMNRGLSEASDEGVVIYGNRRPHRILKFVYRDQVTLKDDEGRTYQVEQPRVEYLIVPAKTD